MKNACEVMDNFMKKLENNKFPKETQIQENGPDITKEFVEEQAELYAGLLQNGGIIDAVVKGVE